MPPELKFRTRNAPGPNRGGRCVFYVAGRHRGREFLPGDPGLVDLARECGARRNFRHGIYRMVPVSMLASVMIQNVRKDYESAGSRGLRLSGMGYNAIM